MISGAQAAGPGGALGAGRGWLGANARTPRLADYFHVVAESGLPAGALRQARQFASPDLAVRLAGPSANMPVDVAGVAELLACDLPPRLRDLIEIAAAAYAAEAALDARGIEAGRRPLAFLLPVRDPAFWQRHECQLAELIYVLCGDACVFRFCRREGPESAPRVRPGAWGEPDCVALLSGGLDSFAGAADLLARDRRPLFAAHATSDPSLPPALEHVSRCLAPRFGDRAQFVVIRCGALQGEGNGSRALEPTGEGPKSLLHLVLGAACCHAVGAGTLFCPDSGVLSLNPTLSDTPPERREAGATQPRALRLFTDLLGGIGVALEVRNPFLYHTKGQLLRDVLGPRFSAREIQGAVSCHSAGANGKPCGACIPCLVRAIAMRTGGLPSEAHVVDPLSTGSPSDDGAQARANLLRLLRLVNRLHCLTDEEIPHTCPALFDLPPEASVRLSVAMLRRFARETTEALYGVS